MLGIEKFISNFAGIVCDRHAEMKRLWKSEQLLNLLSQAHLTCQISAIHKKRLAGDVTAGFTRQE
jgi:hypothetical protein